MSTDDTLYGMVFNKPATGQTVLVKNAPNYLVPPTPGQFVNVGEGLNRLEGFTRSIEYLLTVDNAANPPRRTLVYNIDVG